MLLIKFLLNLSYLIFCVQSISSRNIKCGVYIPKSFKYNKLLALNESGSFYNN